MNLPHAMISTFLRRTTIGAAAAGVLLTTSCTILPPPGPPGPPFPPDGRPRYGHNGTDSPHHTDPRALPGNNPGQPYIKRDPNNERVDITPPEPRPGTNPGNTPPDSNPGSSPSTDPAPAPQPLPPREDLQFGIPVVGKKGMVYSPFAPEKGFVDVENLKRGTRVKCPYTGKHFRVP